MAREFSEQFYNSKQWKRCRKAYKQSIPDESCERCQEPGEEVHHKIYLTPENINDPYITLSWDNLELLCMDCHKREHRNSENKVAAVADGYSFSSDGQLVYTPPHEKNKF